MAAPSIPDTLPDTLSQRVQLFRELCGITQRRLADEASLPHALIEDIESGIETILSPFNRRKLARALRIPSLLLKIEVDSDEPNPADKPLWNSSTYSRTLYFGQKKLPLDAMLTNPEGFWPCPDCGQGLHVRTFERRDLEDTPLTAIRLDCQHCLFRFEDEFEL